MNKTATMLDDAPATDEAAITALYQRALDGWNEGSGAAFAAAWADDGQLIGFDGTQLKGRAEIAAFHEPLFTTYLKGTRLVGSVRDVEFPAPDVAVFHADGRTIMAGASEPTPERDSIQTMVAVRRAGAWELLAFQNTRVRPMGRDAAGTILWLVTDWLWKKLVKGQACDGRTHNHAA
jgi:uncharacterized protein (TIGR02246 family)